MAEKKVFIGTGRRKASIAQVKMVPGIGKITVNGVDVREFFPYETNVMDLKQPLVATNTDESFNIDVKVNGGGFNGQTGAIRLGITRALLEYDSNNDPESDTSFRKILKRAGFITRDSRIKERKKPGLKAARRAPQFSKR
ncbi:MAG: 30S ribosomal protein S9 [Bacilli bacterium]|nr:30S ribosomal protein S9 [Bacilli bacterium]MDD4282784.1 30S ribosomal protein S9 [Bacilli bacterium]MDD4718348.1 30S ribosomal protein S9 [Bacilli bacterium]